MIKLNRFLTKYGDLLWLLFGCLLVAMGLIGDSLGVKTYTSIDVRSGVTGDRPIWILTLVGCILIAISVLGMIRKNK